MAAVPPPVDLVPSSPSVVSPMASRPAPRVLAPRPPPPGTYAAPPDGTRGYPGETFDLAAHARHPVQEGDIVDAVGRGWSNHRIDTGVAQPWPGGARQLGEEARQAYVRQRNVRQAYELQLRAFGANPRDPDGREADTTHAWYVAVALSRDLDRSCRVALDAAARHGDVMLAPVQAMMLRIRQHGRERESPNCTWPPGSRMARSY